MKREEDIESLVVLFSSWKTVDRPGLPGQQALKLLSTIEPLHFNSLVPQEQGYAIERIGTPNSLIAATGAISEIQNYSNPSF